MQLKVFIFGIKLTAKVRIIPAIMRNMDNQTGELREHADTQPRKAEKLGNGWTL